MQKLTFTKTGIQCSFLDQQTSKWIDKDAANSELPFAWYLQYNVVVEEGVTLRQILMHLVKYEDQVNFIFVGHLKGFTLSDLIKTIDEAKSESTVESVDAVCLLWLAQLKQVEGAEEPFLATQAALMALEMPDKNNEELDDLHSVNGISSKQALDSPFVLDDLIEYIDPADPEEAEFIGLVNWNAFDFIGSLFNELVVYAYLNGSLPNMEKIEMPPLSADDLFDHLDELDLFFTKPDQE